MPPPSTRSFVTLAFADELTEDPALLAAYASVFGEGDDATLLLYAPAAEPSAVVDKIAGAAASVGVDLDRCADMVVLATAGEEDGAARLGSHCHAVLSNNPESRLGQHPIYTAARIPRLRAFADQLFPRPTLAEEIDRAVATVPADFGGGSPAFKGQVLGRLITERGLQRIVEIGVYHGRCSVALSAAARRVTGARVWGIDPYCGDVYDDPGQGHELADQITTFIAELDYDAVCAGMLQRMRDLGYGEVFTLLREPSLTAAEHFDPGTVDLLHIDGDHSRPAVEADLEAWLPRMRPGGIVVFDDVSWRSIAPVAADLQARCEVLFSLIDPADFAGHGLSDFLVLGLPIG
jgi:predicted O-methyltransferase YrrM